MKKKRIKILLCEYVNWRAQSWYHVVYFPSENLDHYLIPADKFSPDVSERTYDLYKIGSALIDYIVNP